MSLKIISTPISGGKLYTGVYSGAVPAGLLRVRSSWDGPNASSIYPECLYPSSETISVVVAHHDRQEVIVEAKLSEEMVALVDESESPEKRKKWHSNHHPDDHYRKNGWVWIPWQTDAMTDPSGMFRATRKDKLRGGNRLSVVPAYPGTYTISVPRDYDVEVDLHYGDVRYSDPRRTKLHVDAPRGHLNKWGDSGCSSSRDCWTYYRGDDRCPVTRIKVEKGNVVV